MADFWDGSLGSVMDYDAEVAYISLTSGVCNRSKSVHAIAGKRSDDEFDFSWTPQNCTGTATAATTISSSITTSSSNTLHSLSDKSPMSHGGGRNPLLPSKLNASFPAETGLQALSEKKEFVSTESKESSTPSSHFDLNKEITKTPTSQLRSMKDVLDIARPSLRPRQKCCAGELCVLVVYGPSGCGRNYLVDTLVHSNPSIFSKVVSSPTRKRQPRELKGVDFHFISPREMSRSITQGNFLEDTTIQQKRSSSIPMQTRLCSQKSFNQGSPPSVNEESVLSKGTEETVSINRKTYSSEIKEDYLVTGEDILSSSYQALTEAIRQGRPCVIFNASYRSAQQLQSGGLQGSYVQLLSVHTSKGRPPREGGGLQPDHTISTDSLEEAYSELYQYALHLVADLDLPITSQYQKTKSEWDALPTIGFDQSESVPYKLSREVTFSELLAHFQVFNLQKQLAQAKAEQCNTKLFTHPKLSKKLQGEKLLVQAITYCSLSYKDNLHLRMLQTVYSKLTGNGMNCGRFSTHWREIGFSGFDPAEDLQELGLLGPVQLIFFLGNVYTAAICREIYQHCQLRGSQTMPFCILSFDFSKLSLDTLLGGYLNKLCNKKGQVFVVTNNFYMAAFYHFYRTWRSSGKALLALGLLQQQCQDYCKVHAQQVLSEFEEVLSARQPQQALPTKLTFTALDELTAM